MDVSEGLILSKIKEKDKYYIISHVESLKKKKQTKSSDTVNRLVLEGRVGQKVEISSYKINKSWGCTTQHDDHSE